MVSPFFVTVLHPQLFFPNEGPNFISGYWGISFVLLGAIVLPPATAAEAVNSVTAGFRSLSTTHSFSRPNLPYCCCREDANIDPNEVAFDISKAPSLRKAGADSTTSAEAGRSILQSQVQPVPLLSLQFTVATKGADEETGAAVVMTVVDLTALGAASATALLSSDSVFFPLLLAAGVVRNDGAITLAAADASAAPPE